MIIFINVANPKNVKACPKEPVVKYGIKILLIVINILQVKDLPMLLKIPSMNNKILLYFLFH
jgi:hypothetical protein